MLLAQRPVALNLRNIGGDKRGRKIFIGILPLRIGTMDGTITENFLAMG